MMDAIRAFFSSKKASEEEYEPLTDESRAGAEAVEGSGYEREEEVPFSWLEYSIFAMMGVAMLWAW
jgi:equilibrative nucleoside transporter 1/2/3